MAMWTGTGTSRLSLGCTSSNTTLNLGIYHSACNGSNLHWAVSQSNTFEKIDLNDAAKNDLNLWIRASSVPLPVELLNFKTTLMESTVQIDWQTSSEITNDYFTVERSKDGINWDIVTSIEGQKSSSVINSYQITDNHTLKGVSYYRLKQIDINGHSEYSAIKSVYIKDQPVKVFIYPNPTTDKLEIESNETEFEEMKIYNCFGVDITKTILITNETEFSITIDVSSLLPGMYLVKTKTVTSTVYKQ
jgi:hypothetical protein